MPHCRNETDDTADAGGCRLYTAVFRDFDLAHRQVHLRAAEQHAHRNFGVRRFAGIADPGTADRQITDLRVAGLAEQTGILAALQILQVDVKAADAVSLSVEGSAEEVFEADRLPRTDLRAAEGRQVDILCQFYGLSGKALAFIDELCKALELSGCIDDSFLGCIVIPVGKYKVLIVCFIAVKDGDILHLCLHREILSILQAADLSADKEHSLCKFCFICLIFNVQHGLEITRHFRALFISAAI